MIRTTYITLGNEYLVEATNSEMIQQATWEIDFKTDDGQVVIVETKLHDMVVIGNYTKSVGSTRCNGQWFPVDCLSDNLEEYISMDEIETACYEHLESERKDWEEYRASLLFDNKRY